MNKRLEAAFDQFCREKLHAGNMTEDDYIALLRHRDVWHRCRSVCADICEDIAKQAEQNGTGNVYYDRSNSEFANKVADTLRVDTN